VTSTFRFPSLDRFEAVDFDASAILDEDALARDQASALVVLNANTGQRLQMPLKTSAKSFQDLAAWATEVADYLRSKGKL
jgi:hypothetical protein